MGDSASNRTTVAVGILTVFAGLIPLLAMTGVLPQEQHAPADPAPSWIGWLIGLMFVSAGLIAIARGLWPSANDSDDTLRTTAPWMLRAINDLLAVGIVVGLAVLPTWIAFGPGPRHFSIGIGGPFFAGTGLGDTIGRVAFGFGAVLGWLIAALILQAMLRRWRR